MVETHDHFVQRLTALGRKHEKMTYGYTTKVGKDGLIVVKPKRRSARGGGAVKLIALVVVGLIAFKAFTLVAVGPVTYNERLAKLESGTVVEQVGAKVLAIDPVTEALAGSVGPSKR
ncbi:hypothetical protein HKX54_00605 [Sulfitobacter sp. M57]|uniref:hypothetical protein n=1 Tax=unclassified Sulfitobacter TaxID=196795 RepID=UPI0023E17462|nr:MULTISPECIES: hypothetical protein [unclassified Sulfitobacter]MDF3412943.1 hypothetical protein [Sulfitobacter sp. KE5]MDF3421773.1 hypothetical protein [Sulfitobacter sp. KE43]MDF3431492.1 hypothetical protein [Sulfitobacter sp. KE42]MDF3457133.1 hypothetical protein [Sulfitobacter sp. S74]MDF3461036.1 hypothetical protein [Sulfitobacter sp. Ks18]